MNLKLILEELKTKYPNKNIVKNHPDNPTEIICEIAPTSDHPEYSKAIAVIDKSIEHYHLESTEEYTVLKGTLTLYVDGEKHIVPEGQSYIIYPMQKHYAKGDNTWVECISTPGWRIEDHIF